MANDIGSAVGILKQLLADDKAKETLSGLLGGLLDNNTGILGNSNTEEEIVTEEIFEEDKDGDIIDAKISVEEKKSSSPLAGMLANMDIQSLYSNMVGCEDKRIILLRSLRPYLNHKRREKIDSAITVMQLVSISSTLGIDKMFGG